MIQHFGSGVFATVMDSYDYQRVGTWVGGWVGVLWLGCVGRGAACELSSSSPLLACTVCTPRTRHTSCLLASQLPLPPFPTCWQALDEVLPAVKAELAQLGGFWVLRPDSGAPCWWRQWGVAGGASLLCPPQPCKMFNRNWGFN
jgi:hypothetical protein